jgi:hypothetical protein
MMSGVMQDLKVVSFIHMTGRVPQGTVNWLIWPLPEGVGGRGCGWKKRGVGVRRIIGCGSQDAAVSRDEGLAAQRAAILVAASMNSRLPVCPWTYSPIQEVWDAEILLQLQRRLLWVLS